MPMRETEVGIFIRFYDRSIKLLNLQNVDGTGFSVLVTPNFPNFLRPETQKSSLAVPDTRLAARITPPEITIHTTNRTVTEVYQNNFIDVVLDDDGDVIAKVFSQEVQMTIQLTIWAEDPRQREFLKTEVERPFINTKKMRQLLFAIGKNTGWPDGFVAQNLTLLHRGDSEMSGVRTNFDEDYFPRMFTGFYEISFMTEIRNVEPLFEPSIFPINDITEAGIDPNDFDFSDPNFVIQLIIDLMAFFGVTISSTKPNGDAKTIQEITLEAAIGYGKSQNIFVDELNFQESLDTLLFKSKIENFDANVYAGDDGEFEV